MATPKLSVADFASKIKAKYPDYAGIDDAELTRRMIEKYPDYGEVVEQNPQVSVRMSSGGEQIPSAAIPKPEPGNPSIMERFGNALGGQLVGAAKGAVSTVYGLSGMIRDAIPGLTYATDKLSNLIEGNNKTSEERRQGRENWREANLKPKTLPEKVGFGAEQIGEYFIPGAAVNKGVKIANAGIRFAEAYPKFSKIGPAVEYLSRGFLEAAPAVVIAKAQGQQDLGTTAGFAMAGPTFGQILNKTGASKLATNLPKAIVGKVSKTIANEIPEVTQSPRQMLWRALKPYVRNRDFDKALDNAVPEIYSQSLRMSRPINSVDDFMEVLKATKKRIWKPYEEFLQKVSGDTGAMIETGPIADAIEGSIPTRQLEKAPETAQAIKAWAQKIRDKKKMSLPDAEEWLQNINAEIKGFYNMYPGMRNAALEAHPTVAAAVREAESFRQAINGKIEAMGKVVSATGGTPLDVKKIKAVYGGLLNLEQEGFRRVNVAKRLAPESLTEQMANVHAAGAFVEGVLTGHPLTATIQAAKGTAYRQAAKMIKERNSSDYLLKKAFEDFGTYVEKAKKAHRIPEAIQGASESIKEKAKITETPKTRSYNQPSSTPLSSASPPPEILSGKINIADVMKKYEPEVVEDIEASVTAKMSEAKDLYQSGIGELSGKGKNIEGINRMNHASSIEEKQGFGKIRVKSAIPELANFPESPGRIAEAIEKDKNNPLYLRVKKAMTESVIDEFGEQIDLAQAMALKKRKKVRIPNDSDIPF